MQVALNTRIEYELYVRVNAQIAKEKLSNPKRSLAQIVAEALELYLVQAENTIKIEGGK